MLEHVRNSLQIFIEGAGPKFTTLNQSSLSLSLDIIITVEILQVHEKHICEFTRSQFQGLDVMHINSTFQNI